MAEMKNEAPSIVERNFLLLLRTGAFGGGGRLEPMSEWKWRRLYRLSQVHGVTPWVAEGLRRAEGDFFLTMSDGLRRKFLDERPERAGEETAGRPERVDEVLSDMQLTNPLLNRKLQQWRDEAGADDATFRLLLHIVAIARTIIKRGLSLRQLIALGDSLRSGAGPVDYARLGQWIASLGMARMASLEASLLMLLFDFGRDEIRFTEKLDDRHAAQLLMDLLRSRRSVSRLRYFPRESFLNFAAEMFKAVKDIEE